MFGCGVEGRVEKRLGFDSLARISFHERENFKDQIQKFLNFNGPK